MDEENQSTWDVQSYFQEVKKKGKETEEKAKVSMMPFTLRSLQTYMGQHRNKTQTPVSAPVFLSTSLVLDTDKRSMIPLCPFKLTGTLAFQCWSEEDGARGSEL